MMKSHEVVRLLGSALVVLPLSLATPAALAAPPVWTIHPSVVEGAQFDAVRGPADRIHLVSTRYYELDSDLDLLVDEPHGDGQQAPLDFPPAIAVAEDGTAHIITRHGGTCDAGHDIRYRSRTSSGTWDRDYLLGAPVVRNCVVSIGAAGGHVYMTHGEYTGPNHGSVHLFEAGPSTATPLGEITNITRVDDRTRMRGNAGWIYLAAGLMNDLGNAKASVLSAPAGDGLLAALVASAQSFNSGVDTNRKGLPDIYLDATGAVHLAYGSAESVYYNRLSAEGAVVHGEDTLLASDLGTYNATVGMSTVAASDDSSIVLAVILDPPGDTGSATHSAMLWTYSEDGGQSWSTPATLGPLTTGGTGRHVPQLLAIGSTFYLFYQDEGANGLSVATTTVDPDRDQDGSPASLDCNDDNDDIHPGAPEQCGNHIDDDCDTQIDDGCADPGDGGGGSGGGSDPGGGGTSPVAPNAANGEGDGGGCGCRLGTHPTHRGSSGAALLLSAMALARLGHGPTGHARARRRRRLRGGMPPSP